MRTYIKKQITAGVKSRLASHFNIGMILVASDMFLLFGCSRPHTYAQDVRPILEKHCLQCHQPGGIGYERSGLDMRTYASLMKGTKYGTVILPGDSFDSVLVQLIENRADPSISMPYHQMQIPKSEIKQIKTWIDAGAKP